MADELRAALKTEGISAEAMIRTEMKAAARLLAVNAGIANGFDRFGYAGPIIPGSRIYCRHMVGWWYTIPMLEATDNGQLADPVLTMGGWNCNHDLLPATEGMVRRTFPGKLVLDWHPLELMDGKTPITVVAVDQAA